MEDLAYLIRMNDTSLYNPFLISNFINPFIDLDFVRERSKEALQKYFNFGKLGFNIVQKKLFEDIFIDIPTDHREVSAKLLEVYGSENTDELYEVMVRYPSFDFYIFAPFCESEIQFAWLLWYIANGIEKYEEDRRRFYDRRVVGVTYIESIFPERGRIAVKDYAFYEWFNSSEYKEEIRKWLY